MINGVKAMLASILVLMLLALGALSVTGSGLDGAINSALANANAAAQKIEASQTAQIKAPTVTTSTAQAPTAQGSGIVDARATFKQVGPAVVTVVNNLQTQGTGRGSRGTGPGVSPEALGSGVIIDTQGYIVTNNHVVANQASLQVIFADGQKASAKLIGTDPYSDLAVIKVDVAVPAVATFGDSSTLEPGQPVIAIGSALGDYANTVTEGIVSGLHRSIDGGDTSLRDLIQTDAAINHGNSGGPLIDLSTGKVIGINTAVVRSTGTGYSTDVAEGLGFAIPSNTAQTVVQGLMKTGSITRPYLGIEYVTITPDVASYYNLSRQTGAYVSNVVAGGPAASAGIVANSIITKIGNVAIDANHDLPSLLMTHKVGDKIAVGVILPNSTTEKVVTVTLAARPAEPAATPQP